MLNNGSLNVHGTLHAQGSAALPVVITSVASHPAPNDWEYVNISGTGASGILDYVYVEYGGYGGDDGAELSVEQNATLNVTHSIIAFSGGDGLYVDTGTQATVADNSFHDNGGYAISLPAKNPTGVHDNVFAGGQKGVEIRN